MALTETPICEFGRPAPDFSLQDTLGDVISRDSAMGISGLLVLFMCNHCPYVKAILPRLNESMSQIKSLGFGIVAISSNDVEQYPEDGFELMKVLAKNFGFTFPYCLDATQEVARAFGAVCTPDFFGYNSNLELQYRGRLDSARNNAVDGNTRFELLDAMRLISETGYGPKEQVPSMGCNIKWR